MNSIEFAINMELDSKRYYLEQAEKSEDSGLKSIFHTLAEEESIHARILKNKSETLPYELIDTYGEIKNIFSEIGNYKSLIKQLPDALDVYRFAMESEKKSLELYRGMLAETTDEKEIKIYEFLINQEKDHFHVLEQLLEHVKKPEEWVESAEFGLRKDY